MSLEADNVLLKLYPKTPRSLIESWLENPNFGLRVFKERIVDYELGLVFLLFIERVLTEVREELEEENEEKRDPRPHRMD